MTAIGVLDGTTEAIVGVQYAHQQVSASAPTTSPAVPRRSPFRSKRWGSDVNASYDSNATTSQNYRHWRFADHLSADSSMRPEVRRRIRSRARYEVNQNNPIGLGIVLTLANDTIGTGPRLHLGLNTEKYNVRIQKAWSEWMHAVCLGDKLHTMKMAKVIDGEALGRITINPKLETPITLDFQTIECDRLEAPSYQDGMLRNYIDGVLVDDNDNPISYDILNDHPGSDCYQRSSRDFRTYDARNVIHWFRKDRPEQHRGLSECQSALALFAYLRRFTLATVAAAETAANQSMVIKTNQPVPTEFAEESAELMHDFWMESVALDRNGATVLPHEWEIQQILARHPATTYPMFKHEIIAEIARCLCMPYNVAAANSSEHNYASGRLDHQTYHQSINVERDRINRLVLDRLFCEWMHEAALTGGVLPGRIATRVLEVVKKTGSYNISRKIPHTWHWDGFAHSDPEKESKAQGERLANGTSHRAIEYAKDGRDIDSEDAIAASHYGLTILEYRRMLADAQFYNGNKLDGNNKVTSDGDGGDSGEGGKKGSSAEPSQLQQANDPLRDEQEEEELEAEFAWI